jgi:sodium transport system permease protein
MIYTIFRKELLDTLRDRRTIIMSILVPLLLFPLLGGVVAKVITSQQKTAKERTLEVLLIDHGQAPRFRDLLYQEGDLLMRKGDIRIREDLSLAEGRDLVTSDSLTAVVYFDPEFVRQRDAGLPGIMSVYYKRTDRGRIERDRILDIVERYETLLYDEQMRSLGIDPAVTIKPIIVNDFNVASEKERFASVIGGMVPSLFVVFAMMGCFHPATDLAAGEKERGTFETLLTIPATRLQILSGKFLVVLLNGLLSAGLGLAGLYVTFQVAVDVPDRIQSAIVSILEVGSILTILSLLLPLTIFFSAFMLMLSVHARSYKEAQSTINPLMILVFVPIYALGVRNQIKKPPASEWPGALTVLDDTVQRIYVRSARLQSG